MFEKEAEEYVDNNFYDLIENVQEVAKVTFKDGAEFGYNKANEWHYVKDGDLPEIGKTHLVYLANGDVITARLREDNVWTTNGHNAFENVTAWKEIVLPKEIVMTKEECEIETSKAIMEMRNHIEDLEKENAELKRGYHYEVEVINGRPTGKAILVLDSLAYAKSIVRDLLNNSDEYAKQRARDFLEEK